MRQGAAAPSALESMRLVVAARRYYLEGMTKSAVADELGVSRFKVARLLDEARRTGVVTIEIAPPSDVDVDLSLAVADRFGLRQALAVRLTADPSLRRRQLGSAAAAVLGDLVEEGDVLGVAWGRTLAEMVRALPALPAATVVQVVGSVPSAELEVSSLDLARGIAGRAGADLHALHVPMVVDDPETARLLRRDAQVSGTIEMFGRLSKALVSIGSWHEHESSLMLALPDALRSDIAGAGAVADVCATVLDEDGREVTVGNLARRTIAITADQLRAVPDVIAVVGGTGRARAVAAALRSGLVHRLVIDVPTALAMLDAVDDRQA
ncbi:MAG: sugar-binding domain-containing protein [Nocardioidaceae bacterium]